MSAGSTVRSFLIRGSISSFAAVVLTSAIGLAESIVLARTVGNRDFGFVSLAVAFGNVGAAVAGIGLPTALAKFLSGELARSRHAARQTMRIAISMCAATSIATGAAMAAVCAFLLVPYYNQQELSNLFVLAAFFVGSCTPLLLFQAALQGLGLVTDLNLRSILAATVALALAFPLASALGASGALIVVWFALVGCGALSVTKVWSEISRSPPAIEGTPIGRRELLGYGLPTLFSSLLVLPAQYFLSSSLAFGAGFSGLGVFAVAFTIANTLSFVPVAISVPLLPTLSSMSVEDPERGIRIVPRVMRIVTFVSTPLAVLIIAFAPEIIRIAYGTGFESGALPLGILAVAAVALGVSGVVGRQISASGRVWWGFAINASWALCLVAATLVVVPSWGVPGASIAVLLSYALTSFLSWAVGGRYLSVSFGRMTWPTLWAITFLGVALGIGTLDASLRIPLGLIAAGISVMSGLRLLERDEISVFRSMIALVTQRRKVH